MKLRRLCRQILSFEQFAAHPSHRADDLHRLLSFAQQTFKKRHGARGLARSEDFGQFPHGIFAAAHDQGFDVFARDALALAGVGRELGNFRARGGQIGAGKLRQFFGGVFVERDSGFFGHLHQDRAGGARAGFRFFRQLEADYQNFFGEQLPKFEPLVERFSFKDQHT